MPQKRIGRREFLKLAIAAAGAAGLSHFRILNIGGADVAYAQGDNCTNDGAMSTDECRPPTNPSDPDTCPEGMQNGPDMCDELTDSTDACIPALVEPDECIVLVSVDVCKTGSDVCEAPPPPSTSDDCIPGSSPDVCVLAFPGPDEDVCPDAPNGDGDICYANGVSDPDICPPGPPTEDSCPPPDGGTDLCQPSVDNPDNPNPVTVSSIDVESASSALPALGGVIAVLGAAALWLRRRLRPEKPEEEESA
jgi:hypothetical protein